MPSRNDKDKEEAENKSFLGQSPGHRRGTNRS